MLEIAGKVKVRVKVEVKVEVKVIGLRLQEQVGYIVS